MKRLLCILLILALSLSLCACGRRGKNAEDPSATTEYVPAETAALPEPSPAPLYNTATSIEITRDNWADYFEICEVPLYMLNQNGGVLEVEQNYCVVLREELAHRLLPYGGYRVDFEIGFDVYVNTLDFDLNNYVFLHTDDLLYALRAVHTCAFTATALPKSAYGSSYNTYLQNQQATYRNAFFTGSATYTDGVWAGFYVDLNTVEIVSVQGTLELAY